MSKFLISCVALMLFLKTASFGEQKKIDCDRDIRPILSDNCFHCHGPDSKNRKAKLQLHTFKDATADRKSGAAIIPGKSSESDIIKRMITSDEDDIMPPTDSNRHVSKKEIELLKQWIDQGAHYSEHWAFVKPQTPEIPAADKQWTKNSIDNFVYNKLASLKLKPNSEADKRTLLRRLSLDLTGLPPTPEEMKTFLDDQSSNAYEKQVDRLLNSPHYGERMAWPWLDAARYADTNGYQGDNTRTMWPWRDWVVKSFNENKPFDQFTVEQIAGDLLPNSTLEQKMATAFLRNHMINGEGGRIAEENRVEYVFDQLETVGTTFLGLTFNCCRCHDHKYDPISQKDYYSFFAFFNQTPVNGGGGSGQTAPVVTIPPEQQIVDRENKLLDEKKEAFEKLKEKLVAEFKSKNKTDETVKWTALHPIKAQAKFQDLVVGKNSAILAKGQNPNNDTYTLTADAPKQLAALKLKGLRHKSMTGGGIARSDSGNFVLTEIKINLLRGSQKIPVQIQQAKATFEQQGFKVEQSFDSRKNTGWAVWNGKPFKRDHYAVFLLNEPQKFNEGDQLEIVLEHDSPHAHHNLGHFKISTIDAIPAGGLEEIFQKDDSVDPINQYLGNNQEYKNLKKAYEDQKKKVSGLGTKVMVMQDNQNRKTYVLNTGLYNQKKGEVTAGVPTSLPPLEEGVKADRLALANWLVSPDNPLTARVTVNRFWAQVFGKGLVKTTENFGIQGERPVNQELLDWLATEFIRSKWDVKHLMRLIVTSSTYRQSTKFSQEKLEADPYNRFLARGPRFRMPSWMIRDQALFSSGILNSKMGGEGVRPYQPDGVWAEMTFGKIRYNQDNGNKLYRRSIYTFWRRIVSPTMFFDNSKRQVCEVKDKLTNTPLHALVTMNDIGIVEAGRALAVRVMTEKSSTEKIQKMYSYVLGRNASEKEMNVLANSLEKFTQKYKQAPNLAEEYLKVGEFKVPDNLDKVEVASLANLALMILNLDESLTKE